MATRRAKKVRTKRLRGANVNQATGNPPTAQTGMIGSGVVSANTESMGSAIDSAEANMQGAVPSANVPSGTAPRSRTVRGGAAPSAQEVGGGQAPQSREPQQDRTSPSNLTPHFEGANAFDPEIGYFKALPGESPEQAAQRIKAQRRGSNGSRTVRTRAR